MAEKVQRPDIKEFIYCAEHNIFFHKGLQKTADMLNKKLREEGSHLHIDGCPMCTQSHAIMIMSLGASSERSQRESLMEEKPYFHHGKGEEKQYIWREADKPSRKSTRSSCQK